MLIFFINCKLDVNYIICHVCYCVEQTQIWPGTTMVQAGRPQLGSRSVMDQADMRKLEDQSWTKVARCSQLSVRRDHSPRLLGAALRGVGTSEARGWGRKAGSRRCSTTFRPQAIRSSLRGHLNCWHRAVPETCSAAVRSDLPARRRPTAGKE